MRSLLVLLLTAAALNAAGPNVIIFFADDLGYGDLGCHGATQWNTPTLDRLAADGMRFTDFYVSQPVCSASRASLLTGCYANRIGISGALGPKAQVGLHDDELTLAELFRARGYATGMAGKWHLGHHPRFLPTRHGFDSWLGLPYSNDMWPHHPTAKPGAHPPLPLFQNERIVNADVDATAQAKLTAQYTDAAVAFIQANKARPFFFYLPYTMPHVPLFGPEEFRGRSRYGRYGDIVEELDSSVRRILAALAEHGLEKNTLVIFTSDNGPWLPYGDHAGTTGGLREGKGTVWEGGVRVPCIMRWPGTIPPGSVCREPAMTIDLLPTLAGVIGSELPKHTIDGRDILPLMQAKPGAKSPHEALAFYYRQNELQAVRSGRWKIVLPHSYPSLQGRAAGTGGKPAPQTQVKIAAAELYDLENDRAESKNLAVAEANVLEAMMKHVEVFRAELGDALTQREGTGRRPPGRMP